MLRKRQAHFGNRNRSAVLGFGRTPIQARRDCDVREDWLRAVLGCPSRAPGPHPRAVVRTVQDGLGRRQGRVGSLIGEEVTRFNPGQVVATPGALAALEASGESLLDYLARHLSGDWGIVDEEDCRENEVAIIIHLRIMSVYLL